MFIQTDNDNNIIQLITVGECPATNGYEVNDIPDEILQNIFSYKYIDGEFIFKDTAESAKIDKVRTKKLQYLSKTCNRFITNGVKYNNKQYSLTIEDQFDIFMRSQQAVATGQSMTWHANDGRCELLTPEQFTELATLGNNFITFHTTYFNFIKQDILSMTDINKIINFQYGDAISEEYQEEFQSYIVESFDIPETHDDTNYNTILYDIDINSLVFPSDIPTDEVVDNNEIPSEEENEIEDSTIDESTDSNIEE